MKSLTAILAAPLLCAGLLVGMAVEKSTHVKPEDVEPYHARVKAAVAEIPQQIEGWQGKDEAVPEAAVKLLNKPVMLSRRYADHRFKDGAHQAHLLVVVCRDSRDMVGHYPENCYRNTGQEMVAKDPRDWELNGVKIEGMEYQFSQVHGGRIRRSSVFHFIVVPGKGIVRDIQDMNRAAEDYQARYYGAAQVQVVMSADDLDRRERDQIFRTLIGGKSDDGGGPITDALKVMTQVKVP